MIKKKFVLIPLVLLFVLCFTLGACNNGGTDDNGRNDDLIDQEIPDDEMDSDPDEKPDPIPTMECFTLQEAYDLGLLTVEDLEELSRFPKTTIDETIEIAIKASYAAEQNEQWNTTYTASNIMLLGYFGEYHGLYAVRLLPDDVGVPGVEIEETIGGVHFVYGQAPEITVWRVIE